MEDTDLDFERDPSFLTCRPPSIEPWNKKIVYVPKNLCDSAWSLIQSENYKVFLRLKPTCENRAYMIIDENTLLTEVPKESVSYKVLSHSNSANLKRKFTFTSILDETATQGETFQRCVLPSLKEFLRKEDCLVMAFGTTSAGKTFTMQGSCDQPGIIPRALSYIFRSLEGKLEQCDKLQPFRGTQILCLNEADRLQELAFKNRILALDLAKYQKCMDTSYMSYRTYSEDYSYESTAFKEMESQIEIDSGSIIDRENATFSVWVSMIEIYNEALVDLLQFPNEKGERPTLTIGEDERGGFFVKNAKQIHVRSGHEAYQVSQFGRTNLHRAPTALNERSSRSHCIFTVTLVRHENGKISLQRFSFVDLAGSERVKKTLNNGKRLVESNSINKSLSVLGKCLQALKDNQLSRNQVIVPVRDSKMTKLFKNALLGSEKLTFIINISTDPILFDETLHVLKFAALAQEILPEVTSRPARTHSPFSRIYSNQYTKPSFALSAASSMPDLTNATDSSTMDGLLKNLKKQLLELERKDSDQRDLIQELKTQLSDAEDRIERLGTMLKKKDADMRDIRVNMNLEIRKILSGKNEEQRCELESLSKQMTRERDEMIQELNKVIHDQKKEIKALKSMASDQKTEDVSCQSQIAEKQSFAQKEFPERTQLTNNKIQAELEEKVRVLELQIQKERELKTELNKQLACENKESMNNQEADEHADVPPANKQDTESPIVIAIENTLENEMARGALKRDLVEAIALRQDKEKQLGIATNELEAMRGKLEEEIALRMAVENQFKSEVMARETLEKELEKNHAKRESQTKASEHTDEEGKLEEVAQLLDKQSQLEAVIVNLEQKLYHESQCKEELEGEVTSLRKAIKKLCTRETVLVAEVDALKAAVNVLEQEASNVHDHQILSQKVATLESEREQQTKVHGELLKEVQNLKNILELKESEKSNCIKSMEIELQAAQKKLEVAEYQSKVFRTLKDKADEQASVIPHLKETIERLENELDNKEKEFQSFENHRNYLVTQQEREIKKLQDEVEVLKKDVHFGQAVVIENLKNSAKKEQRYQDELDKIKSMKIIELERNWSERSPLKNRTNILVEISPFYRNPSKYAGISRSQEDISTLGHKKPSLISFSDNSVSNTHMSRTPQKETDVCAKKSLITFVSPAPENYENTSNIPSAHTPEEENAMLTTEKSVAQSPTSKSTRKARTTKKRDPRDHPALSRNGRGRRRSASPRANLLLDPPRSVKKKLFSCDDFVELSDDSDFEPPGTPNLKSRLRPRRRN